MTSFQSELGGSGGDGGEGIAEELAGEQRAISIAEFFDKNKHMLGFDSGARGLVTAVKEAVDNALDATEEADVLPDIYVEIEELDDYYRLVVEDNGPGITREQVPKIFGKLLYGSRFGKREQNRGQQGIGISAAVLYSQKTSGKPAKITSKPRGGDARYFELIIDTDTNEPEIDVDRGTTWERPHGTRIELEMEGNMRARQQLHDYIEHTAVVNPHARIELREPGLDEPLKFERATDQLPAETAEIKPHPHGVELGTLKKMLAATDSYSVSGFLQEEFTRVGATTAGNVVDAFRDRQFGREMAWRIPTAGDDADVTAAVVDATANKGAEATDAFGDRVAAELDEHDAVGHGDVSRAVDAAAEAIEEEFDVRLGTTVRENAVAAAWAEVTTVRESDCYRLVDDATTKRKDDAAIEGLGRRVAGRFADAEAAEAGVGDGARDRATRDTLAEWVEWAAERTEERDGETFGATARENVVDAFWARARTVRADPPKVSALVDDRDAVARLLEAMRETDILSPPTDCLAPITAELVEAGLRKEYDADFFAACTRDAEVHGGDPFIVEAGIAYGGALDTEGSVETLRFANRVPLVYQRGACATVDVIKDINWRNYNLDQPGGSGIPNGPAVLMVHVASTNVPFTSESKDAVANVPEIEDEIELALREAARELKTYLNRQRSLKERRQKRDTLAEILPEMADKLTEVTEREPLDIDDSLARIMNNVLVERRRENGHCKLVVENNDDAGVEPEITDICSVDPGEVEGASVVEMDGEWFVRWEPSVGAGETAELVYDVDDAEFEVAVEGIAEEKLTTNT
ncbi:DNA topoisomerase VI subunit B [Haloglomus irregulare]|jgi:DNA topoisomerase-6 subunit B|uniref:Type 2 DNA topoisomerase 6 subunit B n=1 Tax=Haloglomus irregulare TaxID=2234134 RepID=A0A554N7M8_9EURY|nr:DNA topoisomerase VI subunit B [Haloglomus irregulare]TSD13402.1 DNA topoisomerase VI subunit B [Haloglomus irregulare]